MDDAQVLTLRVLFVVGVVEPLTHFHDAVADTRDRDLLPEAPCALEDRLEILAADVLERDEVIAGVLTEVEDLRNVGVVELPRDLRLIDEHVDERLVLGDRG